MKYNNRVSKRRNSHFAFRTLLITLHIISFLPITSLANEALRIAGMGGVFIGISSSDAGVFGNPAVLTDVDNNNLAFAFSMENFSFDELPKDSNEQYARRLSLRSKPSLYYSRSHKGIGFSVGLLIGMNSTARLSIESTRSDYIVNERKFESDTDVLTDYGLLWEGGAILGLSKKLHNAKFGMRLKILRQIAKHGQLVSTLHLTSIHGEDVNPNKPKEFIPAIIDNVEYEILRGDNAELDLSVTGLDIDIGIHADVLAEKITAGFVFSNLLQRKLTVPRHATVGIGVGYTQFDWITAGLDLRKKFGEKGLAANLGWEIYGKLRKGASVDVALRNGISRENAQNRFSLGIKLALGNSCWEYAQTRRITGQSFRNANHVIASTICF